MTKMSFMEKLSVLFEVTASSSAYLVIILALIVLGLMLFSVTKKNIKNKKLMAILIYILIIGVIIGIYHDNLANMFDYLMNNLFIAIYFPNLAIYFAAIIITNIIIWKTVFNTKTPKIIRTINIIVYCIMTYILILILSVINSYKLDVFMQTSIYSNEKALGLIELSSIIFIVWVAFLLIYSFVKPYFIKDEEVKKVIIKKTVRVPDPRLLPKNCVLVNAPRNIKVALPRDYSLVNAPKTISINLPEKYTLIDAPYRIKVEDNKVKVENDFISEIRNVDTSKDISNLFTIDDYKKMRNLLQNYKEKEQELERQKREQEKFAELRTLYQSIR